MALSKNIKYPNGTESNYHKISEIVISSSTSYGYEHSEEQEPQLVEKKFYNIEYILRSYVSATIRKENESQSLVNSKHLFFATANEVDNTPIFKLAYDALKKEPAFEGSEDI